MLRLEVGGGGRCFEIIIKRLRQVEAGLELLMREIELSIYPNYLPRDIYEHCWEE